MKWLQRIRQRMRDVRTIKDLSLAAEQLAIGMGDAPPGAEHFMLAAINMADGTAHQAFEFVGADPDQFRISIDEQYDQALRSTGIEAANIDNDAVVNEMGLSESKPAPFQTKPDVTSLFKRMHQFDSARPDRPLLGASVVFAAASLEQGVTARTLRAMNVDRGELAVSAQNIVDNWQR